MMVVALLSLQLHIPESRSLKDKRMILQRLKDRLKKLNVAVAEVDHQDLWQRATLGVVTVGSSQALVEHTLATVTDDIERLEPDLIVQAEIEFLA